MNDSHSGYRQQEPASNCPITRKDIKAAEDIFGPNLGLLKGKTTRSTTNHVQADHVNILINVMSQYRDVTIAGKHHVCEHHPIFCDNLPSHQVWNRRDDHVSKRNYTSHCYQTPSAVDLQTT
jgi:hypothetical protein